MQDKITENPKYFWEAGRRLKQIRIALGFDRQEDFAKALGDFTINRISRAERGENAMPSEILYALVTRFGIDASWVLAGEGGMFLQPIRPTAEAAFKSIRGRISFTPEEEALIVEAARARREGRPLPPSPPLVLPPELAPPPEPPVAPPFRAMRIAEAGFREVDPEELGETIDPARYLPIISRVAAGAACDTAEAEGHPPGVADSYVEYLGGPPGAFALRIVGDSMSPDYLAGDLVVVDPGRPVKEGVAVVVYEDEEGDRVARLKRVSRPRAKVVRLESVNPAYPPVEIAASKVRRICAVINHLRRIVERTVS